MLIVSIFVGRNFVELFQSSSLLLERLLLFVGLRVRHLLPHLKLSLIRSTIITTLVVLVLGVLTSLFVHAIVIVTSAIAAPALASN